MDNFENLDVHIVRRPGDHRRATVKAGDLFNFRWDTVTAEEQRGTASPVLFASIICAVLEDEWAHAGVHGACPHIITVAIQRVDNSLRLYTQLAEVAGPKPSITHWTAERTGSGLLQL